ncbi:MAG: hypothetical protein WCJ94_05385 [bacterium]
MKPFDCDFCHKKIKSQEAIVRWHYEKTEKAVENFQIVHNLMLCNFKGPKDYFNRSLELEYVFKNMPEFLTYIKRLKVSEKELKKFVQLIEKDRSYIRRFNTDKNEVKKLIIRLEGLG